MDSDTTAPKRRWTKVAKHLLRWSILALVAVGIWRSVGKGLADLRGQQFSWAQLKLCWILVSALA